jgi:predicted ATP-dependent endonuclease of OLD family
MKLVKVTVHGYRRFKNKSTMNVDGRIVAIVGSNEAGKSSFLKALHRFNETKPFIESGSYQELSREANIESDQKIIEATFLLEESDKQAIEHIPEAKFVRLINFYRHKDGKSWMSHLPPFSRNIEFRKNLAEHMRDFLADTRITSLDISEHLVIEEIENIIPQIDIDTETLSADFLNKLSDLPSKLQSLIVDSDAEYIHNLPEQLSELIEHEKKDRPTQLSSNILFNRIPKFLFFDDDSRLLQSAYTLDNAADSYPSALQNLIRVAELNLDELINNIKSDNYGKVESLIETANEVLVNNLSKIWSQSGITVRLRADGDKLKILVKDANTTYVPIAERSDGLRQFVALVSFVTVEKSEILPILLIDEAETHLHYDAQADFVQMLTKQNIASKVIYTTHSIGCLPEDLGSGIRLIEPQNDGTSIINNWFWNSTRQGFSPLLFGMGAMTLAYIPIRHALITEGASDIILLPAILREATKREFLGF